MPTSRRVVTVERVADAPEVPFPTRATDGSACFDLCSAESVRLRRGKITLVRTGLRMRSPPGTFIEVRPRSGLGSKGVIMPNAPGTIDRDYAGEVKVPLTFLLSGGYRIEIGDRIGQVRVVRESPAAFRKGRVTVSTDRDGGFGSTGR
ncbi:MAG: dUTP diphosphatase [Thermoplasmata archaeon]|nr:dUTP diphosphatase [Thermoplasmata archaeon]